MKICKNNTIAYRDYGQFGVVMNARNARFLKLNTVGVDVWEFLQSRSCVGFDEMVNAIFESYDVERGRLESDIKDLLVGLSAAGIVMISEEN